MEYVYSSLILILIIWCLASLLISYNNDGIKFKRLSWWGKLAEVTSDVILTLFIIGLIVAGVCAIKYLVFG